MFGIYQDIVLDVTPAKAFVIFTTETGLNSWWTDQCKADCQIGGTYEFHFNPDYHWLAEVLELVEPKYITWVFTDADSDWTDTRLSFRLIHSNDKLILRMEHTGWKTRNHHFRHTSYCWAQYLRKLKEALISTSELFY